jgi:serine/threonine-protein kinase HipA
VRLGVESLYSVTGVIDSAATPFGHHDALIALSRCLTDFDVEVVEYMKRDLLNIALGNRDNHGRNTAVLKETDGKIFLAPLYDLGPAFLDARNIVRVIRWDGERPEDRDWNRILENLATRFEEHGVQLSTWRELIAAMRAFADELEQLPDVMADCGVDQHVIARRATDIQQLRDELRSIRVAQ